MTIIDRSVTLHDITLWFMLLHVYHRSIYNSHDTILHYDLCYYMFITDLSYNSYNITRYYTMIYVITCLVT
jgi:hypothetical protein